VAEAGEIAPADLEPAIEPAAAAPSPAAAPASEPSPASEPWPEVPSVSAEPAEPGTPEPAESEPVAPEDAAAAAHKPVADDTTGAYEYSPADFASQQTPPPVAPPVAPPPVAPPAGPPTAEHHRPSFQLAEVQLAQRHFNDSQFINRIRDVRKSLGKPKANLTKLIGEEPRALLTVAWDIIWYQYLIELRRGIPTDERVTLHREGMDLDELTGIFKERNASIDDEGRLDASELEVKLLSDPSTLITEMSVEEERALEDATEEIWDQKTAPEFKWDD
jgi:hypothetical protein